MCLAQGHNTVPPVTLEPTTPGSRVKHSTTEPLHSLTVFERKMFSLHALDYNLVNRQNSYFWGKQAILHHSL